MNVADLRPVDLFDDLTDAELEPWAAAAEEHTYEPAAIVIDVGDDRGGLWLLLEGEIMTFVPTGDTQWEPGPDNVAPTWIGAVAAITEAPVGVRMEARTALRLAVIPSDRFIELTLASPPVFRKVMRQVRPILSRIAGWEQNRERLATLGTMSAGLAHELNNPAAAAMRSAAELARAFEVLSSTMTKFIDAGVSREDAARVVVCMQDAVDRAQNVGPMSALEAADAEDELLDALEAYDVPDAFRLTEPLAAAGVDAEWLEHTASKAGKALPAALEWIGASITAAQLTDELKESTERMSSLVGAIKSYAYMDRGGVVEANVTDGIDTTLKVLKHKIKHTHIKVVRDYAEGLPTLRIHGSALNQVWTNLLDNAIHALGEEGTITIRARIDGPCVLVEFEDDGPGIPADTIDRIFDPFFTTKEVGSGTGLGLDTARRIVTDQHRGSMTVESEPGRTVFRVWLPLSAPA